MSIIFYILSLCMMAPIAVYFYFFFRRLLAFFGIEKGSKKSRVLSIILALAISAFGIRMFDFPFIVLLHFFLICIVLQLTNFLLVKVTGGKKHKLWNFLYSTGCLALVLTVAVLSYGYYNMNHVQRTVYNLDTDKMVSARVIQISDLHTGTSLSAQSMKTYFDQIEEERADLIVLTGDIFDEDTTKEEMEEAAALLGDIKTTYGTYYIYGNHDLNQYVQEPAYTADYMKETLEREGIIVLEDEVVPLENGITLIGRLDASMEGRKSAEELISQVDPATYLLLLDHQPIDLAENGQLGYDLELSGHTHGGQIWPMGILSKAFGINEEVYGLHAYGNMQVIVSSGISGWGYPIRTQAPSEYVVIQIN